MNVIKEYLCLVRKNVYIVKYNLFNNSRFLSRAMEPWNPNSDYMISEPTTCSWIRMKRKIEVKIEVFSSNERMLETETKRISKCQKREFASVIQTT